MTGRTVVGFSSQTEDVSITRATANPKETPSRRKKVKAAGNAEGREGIVSQTGETRGNREQEVF